MKCFISLLLLQLFINFHFSSDYLTYSFYIIAYKHVLTINLLIICLNSVRQTGTRRNNLFFVREIFSFFMSVLRRSQDCQIETCVEHCAKILNPVTTLQKLKQTYWQRLNLVCACVSAHGLKQVPI